MNGLNIQLHKFKNSRALATVAFALIFMALLNPRPTSASSHYVPTINHPLLETWRWHLFPEMSGKGFQCMIEAKDGAIWFGANAGVVRYDGLHWTVYSTQDGLSNDVVLSICQASDGKIYAGTESGLYVRENEYWTRILPRDRNDLKVNKIKAIGDDVWVGTDEGLFRINKDRKISLYTSGQIASEISDLNSEVNIFVIPDHVADAFNIFDLYQDYKERLWLGAFSGQIMVWDVNSPVPLDSSSWRLFTQDDGLEYGEAPRIIQTSDKKIWTIFDQPNKGINIFDFKTRKWQSFRLSDIFGGDDINWSITQTSDGAVWIGGHSLVLIFKNGQWQIYRHTEAPLPTARISILEARDGAIWLAGRNSEVYRIDYNNTHWETYPGLHFQCESKDGAQWFITREGNVVSFTPRTGEWTRYGAEDGLIDMPVALAVTVDDVIWAVGSHQYRAATAYFTGDRWVMQRHPNFSWGIDYRSLYQSADSSLWFGASPSTYSGNYLGGVLRLQDENSSLKRWTLYSSDVIGKFNVVGIAQSKDKRIWTGGIFVGRFDGKTWTQVKQPTELATEWFDDIINTPSGDIWLSKGGVGLFHYKAEQKEWQVFTVADGLASNMVTGILCLADGTIMAATPKGISRFDGRDWITLALPASFNIKREGGTLRQSGDGAIWINIASRLWYRRAFNANPIVDESFQNFRTIRYKPDNYPPETRIFQAQEKVSKEGNTFIIWEGSDYWQVTPKTLLQYSYRIDGSAWSPFSYENQKIFFSLSHGHHVFEVRARDRDLNVDPTPATVNFHVMPPLWMQTWFIALLATFSSIIVFLLYYLYKKQLKIQWMEARKIHEVDMMKLRFYTNISHELRTPLSLILGPLNELLARDFKIERQSLKNRFELMQRNAKRLLHLVDEVIDLRKIEAGCLYLTLSQGDIFRIIRDIVTSFHFMAQQHKITLKVKTNPQELATWFDANKLEKILYNLLSNAFKFTPDHGTIFVSAEKVTLNGENVIEIIVEDTGPGIPERHMKHIFERFHRVEPPGYNRPDGAGIGLALTKELVELHHGEIFAQNKQNGGAKFTVRLSLDKMNMERKKRLASTAADDDVLPDSTVSADKTEQNAKENSAPQILIVEDSADMRSYIRDELRLTYRVVCAANGRQGVALAKKMMPDLIISDIMMPEMDGIELCKRIKSDEITSHIPVILLTARSSEDIKVEGLKTGADDYVTKPFNLRTLSVRISNLLESRKKLRERFSKEIKLQPGDITITSVDENFLQRAIKIVEDNISNDQFDVIIFSAQIGMSRSQLFRKLKALTCQTPQEFIRTIRLKRAAQLLEESQMTVTEICYEVEFSYPSHFAQHFRAQFGISPKSYQKKL